MPLPRLLLPLCVLLLTLAVTAASAVAPVYGTGEVVISVGATPGSTTRFEQLTRCSSMSGVLAPMVTDAVYMLVSSAMDSAGVKSSFGYMGGSTMLSSAECTTSAPSLSCIWYWDQGRYAGEENALAFYKGNREPRFLSGAGMVSTTVGNYWGALGDNERFPSVYMQRYGAVLRDHSGAPNWADTSDSRWSYASAHPAKYYTVCATEQTTVTPAGTTTTTNQPPEAKKSSNMNLPVVIGVSVGAAVVVGVIVVLILSLPCCCGWCCFARSRAEASESSFPQPEDEYRCEHHRTGSQRGDMSRANSLYSRHSEFDAAANRSFYDGASNTDACSRRSSSCGDVEMEESQDVDGMMSDVGSPCRPASAGAYAAWAPPPPAATMATTAAPPQMMPMQSQRLHNDWQGWEAQQTTGVYAAEPQCLRLSRRPSSINFAVE